MPPKPCPHKLNVALRGRKGDKGNPKGKDKAKGKGKGKVKKSSSKSKVGNAKMTFVFHQMPNGYIHGDKCEYLHEPKKLEASSLNKNAQPKAEAKAKPKTNALATVAIAALASALTGRNGLQFAAGSGPLVLPQALISQGVFHD